MSYPLKFKFYVDENLTQEVAMVNGVPNWKIEFQSAQTVIIKVFVGCTDLSRELAVHESSPDTNIKLSLAEANQAWQPSIAVTSGGMVQPGNGLMYRCTRSGISGATQPLWPTIKGEGVNDGTARYVCAGEAWDISNMFIAQSEEVAATSISKVANLGPVLEAGPDVAVPIWIRAVNPSSTARNDTSAPIMQLVWNKVIERESI